ncbi:MAG: aminoacyl-tRNA hydrolase [Acidobacteriota bacterium]
MKLIVGLGNPGVRYARTRHNVGFRVVEAFASRFRITLETHEKNAMTGRGRVGGEGVVLATPLTFMNLSGTAVAPLTRSLGVDPLSSDLMIVHDEIDLPLGRIRLRENGSPGTHNGMKSVVDSLGTDVFPRLRFGVRGERYDISRDLADYVLEDFLSEEEAVVDQTILTAVNALFLFARGDLRRAMNEFNRNPDSVKTETF